MDRELRKRIWPVFVEEAREHLQQISAGLLELERDTGGAPGLLESLKRTAHGLKGSAASLGLTDIERLAHGLEDALVGREKAGLVEAGLVEAMLAALDAAEAALARGDSGAEPTVENLAEILSSLTGGAGGAEATAEAKPAPAPEADPLEELWPVFRGEALEHLQRLERAFAALEARGAEALGAEQADELRRVAGNLHASASVLGLSRMGELAADVRARFARTAAGELSPGELEGLRGALAALAEEIRALAPAGAPSGEPAPARPPVAGSLAEIFLGEARDSLAQMERIVERLCSPFEGDRRAEADEGTLRAHNLKGSAGAVGAAEIAEIASRIHEQMPLLAEAGVDASRAVARIAGLLVDLKGAIGRYESSRAPGKARPEAAKPPQPAAAPETASPSAPKATADRMVRASVGTLESLARQIENIALVRARQERRAREMQALAASAREVLALCEQALTPVRLAGAGEAVAALDEATGRLRQLQRSLLRGAQESLRDAEQAALLSTVVREDLKDLRMMPAAMVLEPMRRTVREVIGRVQKRVELRIKGGEVRLDRRILDELKNPLLHMVRNAIDHGIESPEMRRALGKPETGILELRVERRGHRVAVVVRDDGAGLPVAKIRAAAIDRGVISAEAAAKLTDDEIIRFIFRSGFSTAEAVTSISGRGVGLDVVHETISRLGGSVDVWSAAGKGTQFTLELPLTLAATMAVIIRAGGERAAIPYESVERVLLLEPKALGTVAGRASALVDGAQLPFSSLARVLGVPEGRLALERGEVQPALLLGVSGQRIVLAVEDVLGQQEIVVHALGRQAASAPHIGGAAVLDDGQVVAVLNSYEVVRLAQPMATVQKDNGSAKRRVLVADDSLTTRSAMKALLEIAGYQVLPVGDGEEAWRSLQESPCQLVVTDVQMPRLDGFGLTRRIKGDERFRSVPVILVTSLDSPADRAAGLEAGADGYLVKREVEHGKLLELVRQLLPAS
ncbi:MAG: Hpt domain-containing protein [Myxococcales bacterium]|jgi:two-component system chemotaxis sensor kinase CheA